MDFASYSLSVARAERVSDPEDLVEPVEELVRAIEAEGGDQFRLYGYSPAHRLFPLRDGNQSMVEAFLMTSEIEWSHGREPEDPTHELVFFNHPETYQRSVFLRINFILATNEATCSGLKAELHLVPTALRSLDQQRVQRLFGAIAFALKADEGQICDGSVETP